MKQKEQKQKAFKKLTNEILKDFKAERPRKTAVVTTVGNKVELFTFNDNEDGGVFKWELVNAGINGLIKFHTKDDMSNKQLKEFFMFTFEALLDHHMVNVGKHV